MNRREFLGTATVTGFLAGYPIPGFTSDDVPGRILFIILEGGMDGLACVAPVGDDNLRLLRKDLLIKNRLAINPFFALHPAMKSFAELLAQDEAAIVHAAAFPHNSRSHFEGQNMLESGIMVPFSSQTGWLGRAMDIADIAGRAMSLDTPLVLRGAQALDNFFPVAMYGTSAPDEHLLSVMSSAFDPSVSTVLDAMKMQLETNANVPRVRDAEGLAMAAGRAMQLVDGPRVAVVRVTEFDTHANQGTTRGHQASQLKIVDKIFAAFKRGIGEHWKNSIVLTATEFGRTVPQNGSSGTEHGTASAGLLAGGLLKRSSLIADWPGLGKNDLFEGRDLRATLDYRSVYAACLERALNLPHDVIADRVFFEPDLPRIHDLLFS